MTRKTFDCVAMKHVIQERQRKRLKGLSPGEESRLMRTQILKEPALAKLWKAAKRAALGSSSMTVKREKTLKDLLRLSRRAKSRRGSRRGTRESLHAR